MDGTENPVEKVATTARFYWRWRRLAIAGLQLFALAPRRRGLFFTARQRCSRAVNDAAMQPLSTAFSRIAARQGAPVVVAGVFHVIHSPFGAA